ncbi:MAG: tRNA guanosine(34) transglycosylase Tgt [Candidatus Puniceispirillum sp.]|nr:tRNA guanosine(34) transglycosylase Tgt [Candidatus Pelagibacter sp.]MBA4282838.1 tRNA guanosine(34) transglycosylase Tgt [Candidatus Puniceispirillum sp.]
MSLDFSFTYQSTQPQRSRLGTLVTPHGVVKTPAFIFCGTKAAVKGITPKQLRDAGTQFILSNTYHLMLQPGADAVAYHGGLQKFTGWRGPMLTDSGGFQIFSLGHGSVANEIKGKRQSKLQKSLLKITEDGATFRSYIDGKKWHLTPEESITIQKKLGADFIVVLDECTPFNVDKSYTERSMHMSHRWAVRSLNKFNTLNVQGNQRLYGIIQGGIFQDLRIESTDFVNSQPFFGHAIGGSLGASQSQMYDIVHFTSERLDANRPIHLLGIGGIKDIFNGVKCGIDTFDCVHPTRVARHGGALVKPENNPHPSSREHINLFNAQYLNDDTPIEKDCGCETCQTFTKGYIHHLLKAKEMNALIAISIHNIYFMNKMMEEIREGLQNQNLDQVEKKWSYAH